MDVTIVTTFLTIGEGNGNPLQYSCLENPMDRGAWLGYRPWGCKESDTTEQLHFHFHFLTMAVFVRGAAGVFPEGSIVVPGVQSRISFTSEEQWHSLGIKIRGEKCIGRLLR